MRNRRSYIENLNAGRERRTQIPYSDLDRTLQGLEERLDTLSATTAQPSVRPRHAQLRDPYGQPPRESRRAAPRPAPSFDDIARGIERARTGSRHTAPDLAGELKTLRSELRQEMASGLRTEFEALRRDIEKAYVAATGKNNDIDVADELDRISHSIAQLTSRHDNGGVDTVRQEISELRNAVDHLAREETLRAVDSRWGDLDKRFDSFEEQLARSSGTSDTQSLERLYGQLEQISAAIETLPDSLPIRKLEDRVQVLAETIENMAAPGGEVAASSISQIESRLDEISRAIVASSVSVHSGSTFDSEPLERIESRLSALSSQFEALPTERDDGHIVSRINELSERIEQLASSAGSAAPAFDNDLHDRLSAIAERLDETVPGQDGYIQGIEDRLAAIAERLDSAPPAGTFDTGAIEDRLAAIIEQFEATAATAVPDHGRVLEDRLDEIVRRLDEAPRAAAPEYDQDIVSRMESHLAALSEQISNPSRLSGADHDGERHELDRETVLETARIAALEAVKSMPQGGAGEQVLEALTGDLKDLERLARRSEERNSKTFEAIHDTLLKIVDRLASLETGGAQEKMTARVSSAPVPSLDDGVGEPLSGTQDEDAAASLSPALAAAAAAGAAGQQVGDPEVGTDKAQPNDGSSGSLFGGLARAIRRKRSSGDEQNQPATPQPAEPEFSQSDDGEEINPELADVPLEPGSGAPDLSAIMKRVREERSDPTKPADSKTAQADFIAAARRAAQAAAAEAEIMKQNAEGGDRKRGFSPGKAFKNKRKAILMGATAIMILVAGYQLGTAFLGGGGQETANNTASQPTALEKNAAAADTDLVFEEEANEPAQTDTDPTANVRIAEPVRDAGEEGADRSDMAATNDAVSVEPVQPAASISEPAVEDPAPSQSASASYDPPEQGIGPAALRDAAASGDQLAMFEVGARFAEGRGVTADLGKAAVWYERSAEVGFAPAQYRIGNMLEKGNGVDRDLTAAKRWYQMAAQQGNASAMHNLAVLFAMGADGDVDNDSAARWFIEAAELGVTDSQFNLGILSAKGVGVPQDLMESYKWFALAANAGDKDALKKRDEVANALRPEQLEKARVAAELWKVKPVDPDANTVTIPDSWTDGGSQTTAGVDMKKAIKNIQLLLLKNGYNPGTPDGIMGKMTTQAISAYQKANNMPATGRVDDALVQSLLESNS